MHASALIRILQSCVSPPDRDVLCSQLQGTATQTHLGLDFSRVTTHGVWLIEV